MQKKTKKILLIVAIVVVAIVVLCAAIYGFTMLFMVTTGSLFRGGSPVPYYDTVDEAFEALEFTCSIPTYMPDGYEQGSIATWPIGTLSIMYTKDTYDHITFDVHKGARDSSAIISDDYEYAVVTGYDWASKSVTVYGNENEEYFWAIWQADGFTYSIEVSNAINSTYYIAEGGLSLSEMERIVEGVK